MTVIDEFCKIVLDSKDIKATIKDFEFWREQHNITDKVIIAGPSRLVGLIDLSKLDNITEWETYSKCSEPTKKMKGNFVFTNSRYPLSFLREIYPMLSETVEVMKRDIVILFKLTEDIAVGIVENISHEEFYYNEEGVMFVEFDWTETKDDWKTTVTEKEFVKWVNGVAKRKHKGKTYEWYDEIYKFECFFEEEEEFADMMMI